MTTDSPTDPAQDGDAQAPDLVPLPTLTERLRIRAVRLDDAAALLAVYGDAMHHLTPDVATDVAGPRGVGPVHGPAARTRLRAPA